MSKKVEDRLINLYRLSYHQSKSSNKVSTSWLNDWFLRKRYYIRIVVQQFHVVVPSMEEDRTCHSEVVEWY